MNLNETFYPVNKIYHTKSGYDYSFLFPFEEKYFHEEIAISKKIQMSNYFNYILFYAFCYLVLIVLGKKYMATREKFELRRLLIAWNFLLSLFSIMGTIRVLPEFIYELNNYGLEHTICSNDWSHGVHLCWVMLFIYSKLAELIDTAFIIARKQKLIFLHWYHHLTVLLYVWFCTIEVDSAASGRWFMVMNFTVHAFMYAYYGFTALRFKIPKWVNIILTSSQILQMIIGIHINYTAYSIKKQGGSCQISNNNLKFSFIMYLSYFILFFNFFYNAYLAPKLNKNVRNKIQNQNESISIYKKISID